MVSFGADLPTTPDQTTTPNDNYKVVPDNMRYEAMKKEGQVPNFKNYQRRGFSMITNPFPGNKGFEPPHVHERRFDLPPINFELRSNFRNTQNAPKIKNYAKRNELWKVSEVPESLVYDPKTEYVKGDR